MFLYFISIITIICLPKPKKSQNLTTNFDCFVNIKIIIVRLTYQKIIAYIGLKTIAGEDNRSMKISIKGCESLILRL